MAEAPERATYVLSLLPHLQLTPQLAAIWLLSLPLH